MIDHRTILSKCECQKAVLICKSEIWFFLSYGLLLLYLLFDNSFFSIYISNIWKLIFVISAAMLVVNEIANTTITHSEFKIALTALLLAAYTTIYARGAGDNSVAMLFLLVFCARRIRFEKIANVSFFLSLFSIIVIVASARLGIITDYVELGSRTRDYLGFKYSLFGPAIISNCCNLWIYIRKERIKLIEILILGMINYWFYIKTDSRLSFGLTAIVLLVALLSKYGFMRLIRNKVLSYCMVLSYVIAGGVSILITLLYNPNVDEYLILNSVLGNRLELGKSSVLQSGIRWLGNKGLVFVGNGLDEYGNRSTGIYNHIDCLYLRVMQKYGVLFLIILLCIITYALYKAYLAGNTYYLLLMAVVAARCMIDDLPQYFYFNTLWIGMGPLLYYSDKDKSTASSISNLLTPKKQYMQIALK